MHSHYNDTRSRPDIRRRIRARGDIPFYALKVLIEALRSRGKRLGDSSVALLGFIIEERRAELARPASVIRDTLLQHGARVRTFDPYGGLSHSTAARLEDAVRGADAVIIAMDHPAFQNYTPRHFRSFGVDIIIPTNLRP